MNYGEFLKWLLVFQVNYGPTPPPVTGVTSINTLNGALNLNGAANQINVASGGTTLALSLPQNINLAANVQFGTELLSGSNLGGVNSVLTMTGYGGGEYINFSNSSCIGLPNSNSIIPAAFWLANLDYDTTTNTYKYQRSTFGAGILLSANGSSLVSAVSGTAGATAGLQICASWDFNQNFYVTKCSSPNTLVGVDGMSSFTTGVGGFNVVFATLGLGLSSAQNSSAILQTDSTTQGFLPPRMTSAQRSGISAPQGLELFNTDFAVKEVFDGTDWQQLLAASAVLSGTNITITNNNNGTITVDGSGSGGTGTQVNGAFVCNNNMGITTPTSSPSAVVVNPISFSVTNSAGMTVAAQTVDSVTTATITNTSTGGPRWCRATFDVGIAPTGSTGQDYLFTIWVKQSGGGLIQYASNRADIPVSAGFYTVPLSVSSEVQLDLNDFVFLRVSSSVGSPPTFRAFYFNGVIEDLTIASLVSTDVLTQGSNNLYVSTNAGASFENVTYPVVSGNAAVFDGTTGLIKDGGIPPVSVTPVTGTSLTMTATAWKNVFVMQNTAPCVLTLPASFVIGQQFNIIGGADTAAFSIVCNGGQSIQLNANNTATSTSGTITITSLVDSLELWVNTANTTLTLTTTNSPQLNFT